MRKIVLIALILALAAGGGYAYLRARHHRHVRAREAAQTSSEPLTAPVEKRTIVHEIDTAGDITPVTSVDVKPEISYKIKKIFVAVGQAVKEGDPLVELDDSDILTNKTVSDRQVEAARLDLDKNHRDYDRAQKLYTDKLVSQESYENAKTSLDTAQNAYEQAQNSRQQVLDQLTKTKILSPLSGTVLSIPVVEGQVVVGAASVNSGTVLMTVADLRKMVIYAQVNQVDIAYIHKGEPANFTVESIKDTPMAGVVDLIYPQASVKNNVKGFQVWILIENPNKDLKPGMTADVVIPVETAKDAVVLPLAAVFTEEDGTSVAFVPPADTDDDDAALPERRPLKLGIINYDYAQVLSGVKLGETVLLTRPKQSRDPAKDVPKEPAKDSGKEPAKDAAKKATKP
jgi:RND family efflux transporter MFP subunit